MRKLFRNVMLAALLVLGFSLFTKPLSSKAVEDGWVKEGKNWLYYEAGEKAAYWHTIDGEDYYFDPDSGYMVTGWQQVTYHRGLYVGSSIPESVPADREHWWWSYFEPSGAAVLGWKKIDGKWYYFRSFHHDMFMNWEKIDGDWYYFNQTDRLLRSKDKENGYRNLAMRTGWVRWNGLWYYLKSSGEMASNEWVKYNGQWYFLTKEGRMQVSSYVTTGGKQYYVDANGVWIP